MDDAQAALAAGGPNPRLATFSPQRVQEVQSKLRSMAWPKLQGCFVVLFTARSGSTFLTRELEYVYDIGKMGETLNPDQMKGKTAQQITRKRKNQWFSFKAGVPGVISGELSGFFEAYMDKTSFLRLVRKDIVGQAISFAKASQTGQWHANNPAAKNPVYDPKKIAKSVNATAAAVEQLQAYAAQTGRPCRLVVYEDFEQGDFSRVLAACDSLGVPRRPPDQSVTHRSVEKMSDDTNEEWRARFNDDMKRATRDTIQRYHEAIETAL
jgi:LPS sulfotransferase NodH